MISVGIRVKAALTKRAEVLSSAFESDDVVFLDWEHLNREVEGVRYFNALGVVESQDEEVRFLLGEAKHEWVVLLEGDEILPKGWKEVVEGAIVGRNPRGYGFELLENGSKRRAGSRILRKGRGEFYCSMLCGKTGLVVRKYGGITAGSRGG